MFKGLKLWWRKHYRGFQWNQWYREEYRKAVNISYNIACGFGLVLVTVALITTKTGNTELTYHVAMTSMFFIFASMLVGTTIKCIDGYELKLRGKNIKR